MNSTFRTPIWLSGHLKIIERDALKRRERVVFDRHNVICDEGKGGVMDWLASNSGSVGYTPMPFTAIILSTHTGTESATDTFATHVWSVSNDYISDDGNLCISPASGSARTAVDHTTGNTRVTLAGTIGQTEGNDTTDSKNQINSVCVVMGGRQDVCRPGASQDYTSLLGSEKLFARVQIGNLVKTDVKTYSFEWQFLLST